MENSSPEKTITAVNDASLTIQKKGRLDAEFPDLFDSFPYNENNKPVYDTVRKAEIVQPVVTKHTIMLPPDGLESIKHFNPNTSPSGIEPTLNRAYYAIKNTLYLWDYKNRHMTVHEEEDDIVGLAFVKPKSNIFASHITHLMILSTVREIKIHAISYNAITGAFNVFQTDMSTTTTGVNMTAIVGTKFGRVYMLGSDGNVWELEYRSEETWFAGKCTKKLHSSGSNFSFLSVKVKDPITQIVVDESGTILYQLTENSNIILIHLGADGRSFNYVDQCTDARNQAASMSASSQQLTPNKFKIVSIHPTLPSESKKYQFVAITSTGCRLYFSHKPVNSLKEDSPPGKLKLEHTRVSADDITANDVFTNAYYKNAVFIGVKNQHDATTTGDSQIITYTPDLGALSNPHNILNKRFLYREFLNDIKVPGKVITLVETEASTTCKINELTASYEEPPRNFLALTTFGLVTFVKQRPIDMLCKLLALTNQDTAVRIQDFQSFCQYFGYINVVSLCLAIICCPFLISSDGANTVEPIPDIVVKGAKDLLVEFGQYPSEVEQQYTSRHDGLALYIYRVINPIWNKTLVKSTSNGASAIYTSNFSLTELQRTQEVLKRLANMMQENPNLFQISAYKEEETSFKNLREFVDYTTEAISFIQYIINIGLTTIVKGLKPESQQRCQSITLKELLTTGEGRRLATNLADSLIEYTFSKINNTAYVVDVLTQHCKSFCGADDVLLYKATKQIFAARSANNETQAKAILTECLDILKKVALHIPADKANEIAQNFAYQRYYIYGIESALACAKARTTLQDKLPFYDIVFDLLYQFIIKDVSNQKKEVFAIAFGYGEKEYAFYMYEKFLAKNIGRQLIQVNPPYLEEFLKSEPLTVEKLELLAEYFKMNERYEDAALTYYNLALAISDMTKRIVYLRAASISAKSVTSPARQYDIYLLQEEIKKNLEDASQQQAIPAQ